MTARCGYTHHGIYVGGGQVVHYSGLSRGWRRGPVEIVSFAEFSLGHNFWAKCTKSARYTGLQAAERALSRLGEDDYRIMTNNCEHFCAWCLDGQSRSHQVERWRAWPLAAVLAIVTRVVSFGWPTALRPHRYRVESASGPKVGSPANTQNSQSAERKWLCNMLEPAGHNQTS